MVTPFLKIVKSLKIFFRHFLGKFCFLRKNCSIKNIQNLISNEKGYIHFRRQTPPSLQKGIGPQKQFLTVFSENTAFF